METYFPPFSPLFLFFSFLFSRFLFSRSFSFKYWLTFDFHIQISASDSTVKVLVVPNDEELVIAREGQVIAQELNKDKEQ